MKNPHCKTACSNNVKKLETLGDEPNHRKEDFRMTDNIEFAVTMHHINWKLFQLISCWEKIP